LKKLHREILLFHNLHIIQNWKSASYVGMLKNCCIAMAYIAFDIAHKYRTMQIVAKEKLAESELVR